MFWTITNSTAVKYIYDFWSSVHSTFSVDNFKRRKSNPMQFLTRVLFIITASCKLLIFILKSKHLTLYRKFLRVVQGEVGSNAQDYDDCVCKGISPDWRCTLRFYRRRQCRYKHHGKVKNNSLSFNVEPTSLLNTLYFKQLCCFCLFFLIKINNHQYVCFICFISTCVA